MTELETYKMMLADRDVTIKQMNATINELHRKISKRERLFRQLLEGWQDGDKD